MTPRTLPADPLRAFLTDQFDRGYTRGLVAEMSGVTERTIQRLMNGDEERVGFDTADALITKLYGALCDVYGDGAYEAFALQT